METVVSQNWLKDHLDDPAVVVVDVRSNLSDPNEGLTAYREGHIPGAVYFDLDKDLSGPVQKHGGRHPLPDFGVLADKLGNAGIDSTKTVIVYDDQDGMFAPRFWWLLRFLGHDQVAVLDEGFSEWVGKKYPITNKIPQVETTTFVPEMRSDWVIDMEKVKNLPDTEPLIDSRAPDRYRGENETMDAKGGHIPGAVNFFWKDNLHEGSWLEPEDLAERFQAIADKERINVYCGSGVTACANILAMTRAGLKNFRLYPGSWSDWITYPENPVETDENKNK